MSYFKLKPHDSQNSLKKPEVKCNVESVIQELKEKMSRLKFRLLDCQNQNQMLRKELLLAKKVAKTEISSTAKQNFRVLLNQATDTDFKGRQEKILVLKDKLNELQNRIKDLEDGPGDKLSDDPAVITPRADGLQDYKFHNKQMVDKELQYLLTNSCQMKRKLEVWKKRNAEERKEIELLRLELEKLLEKSSEDREVHQSYRAVEKELRSRQTEKLDWRSKLDLEKTRNEQLVGEIAALKEDIALIRSKTNDDKVLIEALQNQQGYLHDLLERQKLISESDNRRFVNDLREIQTKHTTNCHTLSHLQDIVEEKNLLSLQLHESMKQKEVARSIESTEKEQESTVTSLTTESEQSQQSEPQQQTSLGSDAPSELNEDLPAPDEEEIKLSEECEQHKNVLRSLNEEVCQMKNAVFSNEKRLNEWMCQLLQTRSLLSHKNAEVRDLEEACKRLQKSSGKKDSSPTAQLGSRFEEETLKTFDVLNEEFQYLLALWQLMLSDKENSLEIHMMLIDSTKWLFVDAIDNLPDPEDATKSDEPPPQVESEEQS